MSEPDSTRVLPELAYWNPQLLNGQFNRPDRHRYVSFDIDQGGLNNIRLVFEYVAVVAAITGRTLVLPPPQPWYLIDNGPQHRAHKQGQTDIAEIFDMDALSQAIPVQTSEEFIRESAEHLSIPGKFGAWNVSDPDNGEQDNWVEWRQWLLDSTEVMDAWNPYETLICYPDISRVDIDRVSERYVDRRQLIEFTPWINAAPLIHFPSNNKQRSLGPVATMLASEDDQLPRLARRLIKHHVRYCREIFELASELISMLPFHQYTALHIRRNDFQYKEARTQAVTSWNNIRTLLEDEAPTYIATDEMDEDFRGVFRSKKTVLFWEDLVQQYSGPPIPEKYVGPIEQLICAGAKRFVGTDLSTFSAYIVRLRGYTRAPDMAAYYHTQSYSGPQPEQDPDECNGREYLRENPLYWLDC